MAVHFGTISYHNILCNIVLYPSFLHANLVPSLTINVNLVAPYKIQQVVHNDMQAFVVEINSLF